MTFNRNSRELAMSGGGIVAMIIANKVTIIPLKPVSHPPIDPPGASTISLAFSPSRAAALLATSSDSRPRTRGAPRGGVESWPVRPESRLGPPRGHARAPRARPPPTTTRARWRPRRPSRLHLPGAGVHRGGRLSGPSGAAMMTTTQPRISSDDLRAVTVREATPVDQKLQRYMRLRFQRQ